MARSFAKILVTIWTDPDFRALTSAAQRLYIALLSSPMTTHAGTLPLQPRKWSNLAPDTRLEDIEAALAELVDKRYVILDEATEEVLIRSFIRRDEGIRTPNIAKTIHAAIGAIESPVLRGLAAAEYDAFDCAKPPLDATIYPFPQGKDEGKALPQAQTCVVVVGAVEDAQPEKSDDSFADFWALFPRRLERKRAAVAWRNLSKADRAAALAALPAHVAMWEAEKRAEHHKPYPTTWLHGRRWEDELGDTTPRNERTVEINGVHLADGSWT